MRIAILLLPLFLAGCLNTPVERHFPEVPQELLVACPDLQLIDTETDKLSDVIKVVTANYGQYQECKIKVDTWIEWYKSQKEIFNSVK